MPLPLAALLSQALVAYTIEFDNEAEHRMPHRTTRHSDLDRPGLRGLWLVSMAMWLNCMQYLTAEPMPVSELEQQARTPTNLDGMPILHHGLWSGRQEWAPREPAAEPDLLLGVLLARALLTKRDLAVVAPAPGSRFKAARLTDRGREAQWAWADVRPPQTLPHFPMVLHRGGFPDGS